MRVITAILGGIGMVVAAFIKLLSLGNPRQYPQDYGSYWGKNPQEKYVERIEHRPDDFADD